MSTVAYDFQETKPKIEEALRKKFPEAYINIDEGYLGRAHVLIIDSELNNKSESLKQELIYEVLKAELDAGAQWVSIVFAYGPDDLK